MKKGAKDLYLYRLVQPSVTYRICGISYDDCIELSTKWWQQDVNNDVLMVASEDSAKVPLNSFDFDGDIIDISIEDWRAGIRD